MFSKYNAADFFDELICSNGEPRGGLGTVVEQLNQLSLAELNTLQNSAELTIKLMGISFTVYQDNRGIDRDWPFDVVPRVLSQQAWDKTAEGLMQRLEALNLFIDDIYHDQKIIKDGVVPAELILGSKNFLPECVGVNPPAGIWAHICGSDLVRDETGQMLVLEDNLRVPSGVSYMLENREVMRRVFPELFSTNDILPVDDYPAQLLAMLNAMSPRPGEQPVVVVLTPGIYNSAYFEHAYLAQELGAQLVEGRDLVVLDDDCVYMRTVHGLERVDVIYRRIDDAFLDPEVFRKDSNLGVPGVMRAWRSGNVALVNAPGAGVADDKVVYSYVPEIIKYYLDQESAAANVPTYRAEQPEDLKYILAHLSELVVKPANESGGYGIVIGPKASRSELKQVAKQLQADPRNFVAQPTLKLSTVPTIDTRGRVSPRHVDLRPFLLAGPSPYVTAGGLTRVAMKEGSLVVNSSQGGGSKDTWVVATESPQGE